MRQILLAAAPSQRRNEILALAARAGVPVARVGEVELRRRVASDAHQGVAARLAPYRYAELDTVLARGVAAVAARPDARPATIWVR